MSLKKSAISKGFNPTEIIFACTSACNLHCAHCFVNRTPVKLNIEDAKKFILSCKTAPESQIDRIGFSGGEPFLYMDFLLQIIPFAIEHDFMFDQIMTNGDWWQTQAELKEKLMALYNAGYDGKFGVSYDKFHGQTPQRMQTFITTVQNIFGNDSVNIQAVGESLPLASAWQVSTSSTSQSSATPSSGDTPQRPASPLVEPVETSASLLANSVSTRSVRLEPVETSADFSVKTYVLPQTFPSENENAWKEHHWFKEDYCQGPGNIFYIHPDGNIAPCCGFANENKALFIGNITDSYQTIMENACSNQMVKICFETGLKKYRKTVKKQLGLQGKKLPGKCSDICTFCDLVCKNIKV